MHRWIIRPLLFFVFISSVFTLTTVNSFAQNDSLDLQESYLGPPAEIAEEVTAPRYKNVTLNNLSPDRQNFLNRKKAGLSTLERYAKPFYNLAGLQIDYGANRRRSLTTQRATVGLELIESRTGEKLEISTPEDITITHPRWSPDGTRLAWYGHFDDETHIYVTDLDSQTSTRVTNQPVLVTLNTTFVWSEDSNYIFDTLVPKKRGSEPERPPVPERFQVKKTSDQENRLRTYQSLLKDEYESNLFEYYTTGQLARINVENKEVLRIGEPDIIENINVAPSGNYLIIQALEKPFSKIVPASRFAWTEEVWDLNGNSLVELRKSEAREGIPDEDELEDYDRLDINWRPDGEGLSLLLDLDADDEENEETENSKEEVTQVIQWLPPFEEEDMEVVYESDREMKSVSYSESAETLFITAREDNNEHLFAVFSDEPDTTYTIYRNDRDEVYEDPGNLMKFSGTPVVWMTENEQVFLSGTEYFEEVDEAPRPFIDRVDIRSGEKERIFQSGENFYERVIAVLDKPNELIQEVMLERESEDMHPDSWLYDIENDEKTKLTENVDYNEAVTTVQRDRFKVERADGFQFWVEVILPKDWSGKSLPGLIWHYPREYDDQEDYDKSLRHYNKNSYPSVGTRTPEILVKKGYAVIRPDWPIVGDRGTSNDNFVWSVVQNSTAVIDSAEAKGYIDRSRMAIGGHSYGAFGTANAMIHTSFFKAGIAGDGNFNRTLTPMGFQREPKDLWRGQERYLQMSPIFWADRLDGALLMYHGEEDQNVGTWPINSKRMFHALNGIGKSAAMYMYPYEGHGPAAEETLMDLWRRWVDWLDFYVKNDSLDSNENSDDEKQSK